MHFYYSILEFCHTVVLSAKTNATNWPLIIILSQIADTGIQEHRVQQQICRICDFINRMHLPKNYDYIPAINSSKTFANLWHNIPVLRVYWLQLGLSPQRHLMCLKQSENCLPHHHLHRSYQNHCPCVFLNYTIKIHDYPTRCVNSTDIYYKYATY